MGGFLDDAAVTQDTFRHWSLAFQIRPFNLFALTQSKQKDTELDQCHSKMFECLRMLLIKTLLKFTDLSI